MAKATRKNIRIRLSSLFDDPMVRSAFQRAERDDTGFAYAIPVRPLPVLTGSEAAEPEFEPEFA